MHPYGCVFFSPFLGAFMAGVFLLLLLLSSPQQIPLQQPPSTALEMFSQNKGDKHEAKNEEKIKKA